MVPERTRNNARRGKQHEARHMLEKTNQNHDLRGVIAREQMFSTEARMHTDQIAQVQPETLNRADRLRSPNPTPTAADGLPRSVCPTEPDDLPDYMVLDLSPSTRPCVCCGYPIKRFDEDVCAVCR